MAEIRPFRGFRYHPRNNQKMMDLIAPLFDVISEKQRQKLYKNPLNSIHLSVPLTDSPAQEALKTLNLWKENKDLLQDLKPAIYPYYQEFTLHNEKKTYTRKGFICMIRLYDWEENEILRHESTIPAAVESRVELIETSLLNSSATHGLYSDLSFELEQYMDDAMKSPIYQVEDYQGVVNTLGMIEEEAVIQRFIAILKEQKVILADGHHRYEGSLALMKKNRELGYSEDHPSFFHMMYLTNDCSDDLRILPTHRLVHGLQMLDEDLLLQKVERYFHIQSVEEPADVYEIIAGKKWCFGLILPNSTYKIRLKSEVFSQLPLAWPQFPEQVQRLDLTVLHYFFIEKVLGVLGKDQRKSENLLFERNFTECIRKVLTKEVQLGLIVNEVKIDEVREVCFAHSVMPQKSTYFYPKTVCGLVFGSISDSDTPFN